MHQYLRVFTATIMMTSGVVAHAEQIDYNPAKVSDSLKAIFQYGSVFDAGPNLECSAPATEF